MRSLGISLTAETTADHFVDANKMISYRGILANCPEILDGSPARPPFRQRNHGAENISPKIGRN
jgi:hypothetical protein